MHTVPHDPLLLPDADASRLLAWHGATLDERLAAWAGQPSEVPGDAARVRLARWARLFGGGDVAALERRLAWDGLSPALLARPLSDEPPRAWKAGWADDLAVLLQEARREAAGYRDADWEAGIQALGGTTHLPFADVWLPLVRHARAAFLARSPSGAERLSAAALSAFERQLASDLSGAGALVLFDAFQAVRAGVPSPAAGGGSGRYDGFVRELLAGGLARIWQEFPALARRCVDLVRVWQEALAELCARIDTDAPLLEACFGRSTGRVTRASVGLSDPHGGGRRVAILEFEDGWRLVYKPRDLGLEHAFSELLAWCGREGLDDVPPPLLIVDRGTHGWVQHAVQAEQRDDESARAYYRRAGGLLCLGYVLRCADLHAENIVAAAEGPVVVDGEVMVQPMGPSEGRPAAAEGHDGVDQDQVQNTCLASGLLAFRHADPGGGYYDAAGLREAGARTASVPRRLWTGLRTDAMAFTLGERYQPTLANAATLGGVRLCPDAYAADLTGGFRRVYRFLVHHRDRLVAAGGPLAGFGGQTARVLFRPSDPYAALLEVMNAPQHWRRGVDRSIAFDSLNRPFARQADAPALWPLAADERRDLERGDVPRFTLATGATAPAASSGPAAGHFSKPGHDAVLDRLWAMGEDDLGRQVAWIEGALAASGPRRQAPCSATCADPWIQAARRLGEDLLVRAAPSGGTLAWDVLGRRLDLYGGHAGIAVFLAALARLDGERWREATRAVLRGIEDEIEAGQRGASARKPTAVTLASVVYALTVVAALLEERAPLDRAVALVQALDAGELAGLRQFDVAGGLAGALLALVTLYEVSGHPAALASAAASARLLTGRQVPVGGVGRAWVSSDGHVRAGFAHGAAGAAYALARFSAVAGCSAAAAAARAALDWEQSAFSPADGNWPAIRGDGGASVMTGWCHGAAGIALALALWPRTPDDQDRIVTTLDRAVRATRAAAPARKDHPCCGTLSRSEALLAAAVTLGEGSWEAEAVRLAEPIAARARRAGAAAARTGGFEYGMFQPGFFQGVAGIGYGLLRVGHARWLPSVAGFATPAWRP